jgi:hypothetical protein
VTDLQSMLRGFEVMMQIAEVAPVMDYLDSDKLVKYLVDTTGIPATVIRSDEEVARMRRQQSQQQEAQAAGEAQMMEAEALGNAAPMVKALAGMQQQ